MFDIATAESTFADGSRNQFRFRGKTGYSLIPAYTIDGGHLNAVGRQIAARYFIEALASAASAARSLK